MFADSCQGMEHALQAAKMWNRKKSNCHIKSIEDTTKFLDLHCVGSVYRNQVNFGTILKRLEKEKTLIYHELDTPQLETELFDTMPLLSKDFVNRLHDRKFNQQKDSVIQNVIQATQSATFNINKIKIINALKNNDESLRLASDSIVQQSDAYLRAKIQLDKRNAAADAKCSIKNEMQNFRDGLLNYM